MQERESGDLGSFLSFATALLCDLGYNFYIFQFLWVGFSPTHDQDWTVYITLQYIRVIEILLAGCGRIPSVEIC